MYNFEESSNVISLFENVCNVDASFEEKDGTDDFETFFFTVFHIKLVFSNIYSKKIIILIKLL